MTDRWRVLWGVLANKHEVFSLFYQFFEGVKLWKSKNIGHDRLPEFSLGIGFNGLKTHEWWVTCDLSGYAHGVHSDVHPESADATYAWVSADNHVGLRYLSGRYLYMNLWRNIDDIHPIVDDHLAVLDQRSLTTGVGSEVCQKNMSCWVRGMLEQYVMLGQRYVKRICLVWSEVH